MPEISDTEEKRKQAHRDSQQKYIAAHPVKNVERRRANVRKAVAAWRARQKLLKRAQEAT